jgi:signal transduction histidine kinase
MHKYRRFFSTIAMVGICIGFVGTVFGSLTYMAKDYNAYNSVYAFFGVSTQTRLALMKLPIGKAATLTILNLSHIMFVLASVMFALLFSGILPRGVARYVRLFAVLMASIQALFMDPHVIIWIYLKGIGPFADIFLFRNFYQGLNIVLRWSAIAQLLFAAALLFAAFMLTPRHMRAGTGLVTLFFASLAAVYLHLFRWLPAQALWLSRVANYIGFKSLPVYKPTPFNLLAPVVSGLFVVCFSLITCLTLFRNSRKRHHDQIFRSKVSAVDTVSRAFCHYLKNELLSQQTELKLLCVNIDPKHAKDVAFIIARNDEIYQHLSAVRDTMKQRSLPMERLDLAPLIQGALSQIDLTQSAALTAQLPDGAVYITGNACQLQEVLICLVRNALEAGRADAPCRIHIGTTLLRHYVDITVSNDGPRIRREEWDAIFDPFFSTKPTKSNWGLGLALCKRIVSLHQGRIWVDETTVKGDLMTTFHILLPLMRW